MSLPLQPSPSSSERSPPSAARAPQTRAAQADTSPSPRERSEPVSRRSTQPSSRTPSLTSSCVHQATRSLARSSNPIPAAQCYELSPSQPSCPWDAGQERRHHSRERSERRRTPDTCRRPRRSLADIALRTSGVGNVPGAAVLPNLLREAPRSAESGNTRATRSTLSAL